MNLNLKELCNIEFSRMNPNFQFLTGEALNSSQNAVALEMRKVLVVQVKNDTQFLTWN